VAGVRAAAAASKLPGYSASLLRALQRRQQLADPAQAAAAAGMARSGVLDEQLPFSLPASLLTGLEQPAMAAAAAALAPRTGACSAGGAGGVGSGSSSRGARKARGSAALSGAAATDLPTQLLQGAGSRIGKQLVLQRSGVHGFGLFAGEWIREGELVIEYIGDLCRPVLGDVLERRYEAVGQDSSYLFRCVAAGQGQRHTAGHAVLVRAMAALSLLTRCTAGAGLCCHTPCRIGSEWTVDATRRGGRARFINHSCGPNCYARQQVLDGVMRIVICAKRDIWPGEELAYDYKVGGTAHGCVLCDVAGVPAAGALGTCRPGHACMQTPSLRVAAAHCCRAWPCVHACVPVLQFEYEEGERRVPCACGALECRGFMN
jgi:histone-lysine N-methyltransferase SETD1